MGPPIGPESSHAGTVADFASGLRMPARLARTLARTPRNARPRAKSARSRKPLWAVRSTVGSNPTPSATTANWAICSDFAAQATARRRTRSRQRTSANACYGGGSFPRHSPRRCPQVGGAGREPRSIELKVRDSSLSGASVGASLSVPDRERECSSHWNEQRGKPRSNRSGGPTVRPER
jgi:hypothetical protein